MANLDVHGYLTLHNRRIIRKTQKRPTENQKNTGTAKLAMGEICPSVPVSYPTVNCIYISKLFLLTCNKMRALLSLLQCGIDPRTSMDCDVIDVTPRQRNRPKRALTSMCMEVTYKCRLLGLSFPSPCFGCLCSHVAVALA